MQAKSPRSLLTTVESTSRNRRAILARQVEELARKYAEMERTGEPFGTVVIAEMGQKLMEQGKDIIFCAESIISTRVPDQVIEATQQNLKEMARGHEAPFLGLPELRRAICARFNRLYGEKVDWRDRIIVTSGSMQAEYYLMDALINPGDEVIIPVPTFFFDIPVRLARGKCVFAKLNSSDNYYHDSRAFERLITKKTKLITLCNPQNPTGRVLTEDELLGVAELAEKHDLLIMHDQVYEGIVYDGRPYVPMAKISREVGDRLVSISSFSKLFNMINYRLGYAIGPTEVIKGMEMVCAFSSMGIPNLLQKGAIAALDKDFEEKHLSQTITSLQLVRDYATERLGGLEGIKTKKPEGTNLLLLDISAFGISSMEFCKFLLRAAGVACAPGVAYHAEGFVRVSLGSDRSKEAIDRIASAVRKLKIKKHRKM
jgi:aspartate aminotransferase